MNISCSICAELFRGPDAHNLNITRCGHLFHNTCLAKWLERKKTCPECRHNTTPSTVIRLFVNIADSSYAENDEGGTDLVSLQNDNDNLKFRIIEKDAAIKSKDEALDRLRDENQKLSTSQAQSRNVILALEQKVESHRVLIATHNDQVKALRSRLGEIDDLRIKLKEANDKNRTMELVQHLIYASQQETEELLKEGRSITELATMVTTLKRELRNSNAKRAQIRSNAEELNKQLKASKDEKLKLEEKCSVLESRVFQLENSNDSKNNSTDRLNSSSESMIENQLPTEQQHHQQPHPSSLPMPIKRTFGDHLTFHKKSDKMELAAGRNFSPSMCIKASSIAGLSPLLKRTKSAEAYKLSPNSNDDKSDTFSILKKPRLIQNHTKKSALRPIRLNKVPTLSSLDEKSTCDNSDGQSINRNYTTVSGQTSGFNGKFRFGGISKPN